MVESDAIITEKHVLTDEKESTHLGFPTAATVGSYWLGYV